MTDDTRALRKLLLLLVLTAQAVGQTENSTTTIGSSGPVSSVRIASPCELIGIGGRIYTLYEYYHWLYPDMELCVDSLPMITRPWWFL